MNNEKKNKSLTADFQLFGQAAEAQGMGEQNAADTGRQGSETQYVQPEDCNTDAQTSAEQDTDRLEAYRRFKAEHKQEFDEDVQNIVRERLRKSARETSELKSRLEELTKAQPDGDMRRARADATYAEWTRQAEETKNLYPSFDLSNQVGDPKFMHLIRSGVDVRTAYEVIHRDEIIGAAMKASAERTSQKIASSIATTGMRVSENGLASGPAATTGPDVSKLSKRQLEEYKDRARRGERIDFKHTY